MLEELTRLFYEAAGAGARAGMGLPTWRYVTTTVPSGLNSTCAELPILGNGGAGLLGEESYESGGKDMHS